MSESKKSEIVGLRFVQQIVREWFESDWQDFDQQNDEGIDGIIILRKKGITTGGIIYVQIKGGSGYRTEAQKRPTKIGVNVGKNYINSHRPRWDKIVDPVICIYVDPTNNQILPDAWWTDLKSDDSYTNDNKNIIIFDKTNKIGLHSKGDMISLTSGRVKANNINKLQLTRSDFSYLSIKNPIKKSAREYYKEWSSEETINPVIGTVFVNRVGWRHITRKDRKIERIIQSLQLLSAARKIIENESIIHRLGHIRETVNENIKTLTDYIGLRAMISFPHRDQSIIQVVLIRNREINLDNGSIHTRIWFYTVYELRRGRLE